MLSFGRANNENRVLGPKPEEQLQVDIMAAKYAVDTSP
jgi:hypothetical protein